MPPAHSKGSEEGFMPTLAKNNNNNNNNSNNGSLEQTNNNTNQILNRKPTKEALADGEIPLIEQTFPIQLVWRNIALFAYLHAISLYGGYLLITGQVMWQTMIWGFVFMVMSGLGITAGCHRLWSHKSYKAKLPLRLLLALFQTIALQNSIHEWSRDHRVHHKYSETNADPHNAKRGFFFAHIGWLLSRKHPAIKEKGKGIDMSDLEADPIIMFQKKYYVPLVLTISFAIPAIIPMYLWGETFLAAFCFGVQFRYCSILHYTWLVNSLAHLVGDRPYDKSINPAENKIVAVLALGEGWHNYHHTFPWDYKTAELGAYKYNWTAAFIDFMAYIGWAYDLKSVPSKIVMQRVKRTGDGSHVHHDCHEIQDGSHHAGPWGWGDKDIPKEDIDATITINPEQ